MNTEETESLLESPLTPMQILMYYSMYTQHTDQEIIDHLRSVGAVQQRRYHVSAGHYDAYILNYIKGSPGCRMSDICNQYNQDFNCVKTQGVSNAIRRMIDQDSIRSNHKRLYSARTL